MKNMLVILILAIMLPTLFSACSAKTNYAKEEPFIIVTIQPAGPDDHRNLFSRNLAVYDNGKMMLYTTTNEKSVDFNAPTLELQIQQAEVEEIKQAIKQYKFWRMPDDVSSPSEDGSFHHTTVNLTDETKTVGGLNPDHEKFLNLQEAVLSKITDNDYADWVEETTTYMFQTSP